MRHPLVWLALALALVTSPASGHQGTAPKHDAHRHRKAPDKPTAKQLEKRRARVMKRATERKQRRTQRQRDRRRALRRRVAKRLKGSPITPAIKDELRTHARRVAHLRQIRFVAATETDDETIAAVDRVLARENARHERWWRSVTAALREASKASPSKASP